MMEITIQDSKYEWNLFHWICKYSTKSNSPESNSPESNSPESNIKKLFKLGFGELVLGDRDDWTQLHIISR